MQESEAYLAHRCLVKWRARTQERAFERERKLVLADSWRRRLVRKRVLHALMIVTAKQ